MSVTIRRVSNVNQPPGSGDSESERERSEDKEAPRPKRLLRGFASLTITQIWIAIIAGSVGSGLTLLVAKLSSTPTIADQIQKFERQQGIDGYTVVRELTGDLRGDGTTSYVLVMRSNKVEQFPNNGTLSDRLFILDDRSGNLDVGFAFQAAGEIPSTSSLRQFTKGLSPKLARQTLSGLRRPSPWVARVDRLVDIGGVGRLDAVGSWNYYAMEQYVYPRPFVIWWNAADQRYVMSAVLASSEQVRYSLAKVRSPGDIGRLLRSGYVRAITLRDPETRATFRSVDVNDYAPVMWKGHLVLVAAYVLRAPDFADERLWQAVPYSLGGANGSESVGEDCAYRTIFMRPRPGGGSPGQEALAAWRSSGVAERVGC
jgi:hypothetical protein